MGEARALSSPSEFGLDVEPSLLRKNEEIAVAIAERSFPHRLVPRKHVHRQPFTHGGVTIPTDGLQTLDKVDLGTIGRDIERVPGKLGRTEMNLGIEGQEARFKLLLRVSIECIRASK